MASKVPNIVATLILENQTSDVNQAIFTPAADGFFRLSLYIDMNGDGTGQGSGTVHITYMDDPNSVNINLGNLIGVTPNAIKALCIPFHLEAGQPLSIATTMDAVINFNLYAVVERLD